MIWGGIHPIIYPEDAISADVDAICSGEGELAFTVLEQQMIEHGIDLDAINANYTALRPSFANFLLYLLLSSSTR